MRRHSAGLTLVELLVGMTIGLLALLAVSIAFVNFNQQRRLTVATADAQQQGLITISIVESALRQAGLGLYHNGRLLCSTLNLYHSTGGTTTTLDGTTFSPVSITDGGPTGSDQITVRYSTSPFLGFPANVVRDMPNASSVFTVANATALTPGSLAIIGVPSQPAVPCTLFGITNIQPGGGTCGGLVDDCSNVLHASGGVSPVADFNPPNPNTVFTDAPTYGNGEDPANPGPAVIMPLGAFVQDNYRVLCNTLVVHDAIRQPDASCTAADPVTATPQTFNDATPLVSGIVQFKAQYGVTEPGATNDVVANWVNPVGPEWAAPDPAHVARIRAIRVVAVTRLSQPATADVTAPCTNAAGIANTGPCGFHDAEAPVIDLSAIPNWQRFRYAVHQSVIPLRNVIWNQ